MLRQLVQTLSRAGAGVNSSLHPRTMISHSCSHREHYLTRSFFYIPGDQGQKITKMAAMTGPDAPDMIVLDCEDAVGFAKKAVARDTIAAALSGSVFSKSRAMVSVRCNRVQSGLADEDLRTILGSVSGGSNLPNMINLPKVEIPEEFDWLADRIRQWAAPRSIPMLVTIMIETPIGLLRLPELCERALQSGHPFRFIGVVFGSDDYCASLGVPRSPGNEEVAFARQKVVNVAKAFDLFAIDMVDIDIRDHVSLERNSLAGARLGYAGKQIFHPAQIPIVHAAYTPLQSQVEWARGVLQEFESQRATGRGIFIYRGQMVDMPTVLQAKAVADVADLIDKAKAEGAR